MQRHIFFVPTPWGPGEGPKGQILNFNQKILKPNFVCLLTNERYKTYQTDFHSVAWVMPQGWDFGVPWGGGGGGLRVQNCFFLNSTRFGV